MITHFFRLILHVSINHAHDFSFTGVGHLDLFFRQTRPEFAQPIDALGGVSKAYHLMCISRCDIRDHAPGFLACFDGVQAGE